MQRLGWNQGRQVKVAGLVGGGKWSGDVPTALPAIESSPTLLPSKSTAAPLHSTLKGVEPGDEIAAEMQK